MQDDIPTKSEIEQYLGILLAQVLCDYSHGEDVNLIKSAPCTKPLQPYTTQDCHPETNKWSQKEKILKSFDICDKPRKLRSCVTQDDIPTELKIQSCPDLSSRQVFSDYIPCEGVKLLDSAPCTSFPQQPCCIPQACQSETNKLSQKQKLLKSCTHHDILVDIGDKSRKLESRVTQGDILTKSEIQQCLGTLLGQVLRDYSHGEDDCQSETDELSQEQKILKSFDICDKSRKLEPCVTQDDIPTKSEIEQCLGTSLTRILCDYSHHEVIRLLDSAPSAKLPQQPYCTARDCQPLQMNKWSQEQKILKAYMHHDILALGEEELKKFQAQVEATTRSKLSDEFIKKSYSLEAKKRFTIRRKTEQIHTMYEECFEIVQEELEKKLETEWADAKAQHNKELQKIAVKTRLDTTHDVLRRLRPQICYIITSLHNNFQQCLRAQREKMIADFNKIIRKQDVNLQARIKEAERKKMEELISQHHELEIRNATDIIYVLCMEKLRNDSVMHTIHKRFEEKIKCLLGIIIKQVINMKAMEKKITQYRNKNIMLEEKLSAIVEQYQKFINFTLDAMPEHANFLLPLKLCSVNDTSKKNNKQEMK
ncbi:hypothetical protein HN011_000371 [Eciton burchellii]|nr:hypothetical protein HN011_000371 [Eciton burchellii]